MIILFRESGFHGYTTVAHLHPILKQLHHWMCTFSVRTRVPRGNLRPVRMERWIFQMMELFDHKQNRIVL